MDILWTYILPFLVILGILVFVHEWGHYIVARWNGVKVEVFSIGFGRELLEAPKVSDDTFNAVKARYGEKGLMELTAVMSVYIMNAAILRVMDHPAPADARPLTPR